MPTSSLRDTLPLAPAMLGPPTVRRLTEPVVVSLEMLVPADTLYRYLEATLDRSVVHDLVRDTYAERGRLRIDPIVFFKPQHSLR